MSQQNHDQSIAAKGEHTTGNEPKVNLEKTSVKSWLFSRLPEGLQRSVLIWKSAKEFEKQKPNIKRKKDELEFLPAAVEILETPVSPIGRAITWTIMSLFFVAIAWSWFGHIDVFATANGRVIPQGQIKAIQPLQLAKVRKILVKEGQHVKAGQHLIELDPTETEVDLEQVKYQLLQARLNAIRTEILLDGLGSNISEYSQLPDYEVSVKAQSMAWPSLPNELQFKLHQEILKRDWQTMASTKKRNQDSLNQQQAAVSAVTAQINRLNALIPLYQDQVDAMNSLLTQNHVSKLEWLQQEERRISAIEERKVLTNQKQEAQAQLKALESEHESNLHQFLQQHLKVLQENRTAAQQHLLTLRKAEGRQQHQILKAPVDGIVQQLQVHTVGGVVQPAQPIMMIVPDDVELEIEASVLNKDIGFIKPEQPTKLKFESFPYTQFGLFSGEVRFISRDAIAHEQLGSVYPIRVLMHEQKILVGDTWQKLEPGMNVTVEIKTGERRLIEFFLAPLLKGKQESFHER